MLEERAAILIDNYYLKKEVLDQMQSPFKLDYMAFCELLCKKHNSSLFRTYVYDCEFKSNEVLLDRLENLTNFKIRRGEKQKLGFQYGVSVDHKAVNFVMEKKPGRSHRVRREISEKERLRRVKLTISNAKKFLDHHNEKKYRFIPIGVVQGISKETYASGVKELVDYGYDYLALGSLVGYQTKEIINILRFIRPHLGDAKLHLFGVLRPSEIATFEELGVVSFDSASYFRKAWLRSGQNYLAPDRKWYAAIRVPYSTQQKINERALKIDISQEKLKSMEYRALDALREYNKGNLDINDALDKVMEYDDLLLRDSNDGQSLRKNTKEHSLINLGRNAGALFVKKMESNH